MIKYLKGNIFDSPAFALVNPVNTVGTMGKGLALQFKQRFPHNFELYKRACFTAQIAPGKLLIIPDSTIEGMKLIVNFPTKVHWAQPSEMGFINSGLVTLQEEIRKRFITSIAIPAIGCGLGDLDWHKVKRAIDRHLQDLEDIDIYVYEPK